MEVQAAQEILAHYKKTGELNISPDATERDLEVLGIVFGCDEVETDAWVKIKIAEYTKTAEKSYNNWVEGNRHPLLLKTIAMLLQGILQGYDEHNIKEALWFNNLALQTERISRKEHQEKRKRCKPLFTAYKKIRIGTFQAWNERFKEVLTEFLAGCAEANSIHRQFFPEDAATLDVIYESKNQKTP